MTAIVTMQMLNEGVKIVVNVKKADGTAKDLTGATNLKIKMRSILAATGKSFAATFDGSPALGALTFTLGAGNVDDLSTWKAQAYYELGGFKGHTEPVEIFEVQENLA
jgi:hypothetical protein